MLSMHDPLVSWRYSEQPPSVDDFLNVLRDCRMTQNIWHTKYVQMHIHNNGLEAHEIIGNHLVSTLMHCGSVAHAELAFRRLVHPNQYSWTCLIQGYTDGGDPEHAYNLFKSMKENGIHPGSHAFVALLKGCSRQTYLVRGQGLHAELVKEGLDGEQIVGNTLVDMYAKCGSLSNAQNVFDGLRDRNVVSWSSLMKGYTDHGLPREALDCLDQMQSQDLHPDPVSYVCCLKACCCIGAIDRGQSIHAQIAKDGLEKQSFVGNVLVGFYARCGLFVEALDVLNEMQARSSISWTALIAGYIEHGLGEEALNCLECMQSEGIPADAITFVSSLKACSILKATDKGLLLYAEMVKEGFETDPCVGTAFIDMCGKCGLLLEAQDVFDELSVQDVVAWNTLVMAYVEHREGQEALNRVEQMQLLGVSANTATYVSSLKASSCIRPLDKGREIHADIVKEGYETDSLVLSSLMYMYAKGGLLADAKDVFDEVPERSVALWNTLITGYIQNEGWEEALLCLKHMKQEEATPDAITFVCSLQAYGSLEDMDKIQEIHADIVIEGLENNLSIGNTLVDTYAKCRLLLEAWDLFECLMIRDIVSWNAMIQGYAEYGASLKALEMYAQMQEQGLLPDCLTFTSILKACGSAVVLEFGRRIHVQIHQVNAIDNDKMLTGAALINMYSKCGSMANAQQVFDTLPERDVVRWTALMNGYARQGASKVVLEMFERMVQEGVDPNEMTFLSVLVACSHMGLLEKGKKYYKIMCQDYSITPTVEHQNCMVDLLGRVCQLDEAMAILEASPLQSSRVTWNSVLGSFEKQKSSRHHRQVFKHASKSDDATALILMSNLYAGHMYQDAEKLS